MRPFLALMFLFVLSLGSYAERKLVIEDKMIFRLETELFFLSDINKIIKKVETYKCVLGDSFALKQFGLNKKVKKISFLQNLTFKKNTLNKLLDLIKSTMFIERENLPVTKKTRNLFIKSAELNKCGKVVISELSSGFLGKILKIEMYMKKRFDKKKISISAVEFSRDKSKFKNLSDAQIMVRLKELKMEESINEFVSSVNNQISHREYF